MPPEINIRNKYIHAEQVVLKSSKPVYAILNTKSREELGRIAWYNGWRQYVFRPNDYTEYGIGCLQSIIKFMETLK